MYNMIFAKINYVSVVVVKSSLYIDLEFIRGFFIRINIYLLSGIFTNVLSGMYRMRLNCLKFDYKRYLVRL